MKKLINYLKEKELGFDIADETWDWGNYFECPIELDQDSDYYDKLMHLFAERIDVIKYQENWFTICDISNFIMQNIDAFTKFMIEFNNDNFNPSLCGVPESIDDYLLYELYIGTFQELINGNYAEKDYEKLFYYLGGEEENE